MAFNWPRFLSAHNVPWVDRGPNINRHQIGIQCPFCGAADASEHMAIHLEGGWWTCRRNKRHGGRTPHGLVARLAGVSMEAAADIVGNEGAPRSGDEVFGGQVRDLFRGKAKKSAKPEPVRFFPEMKPMTPKGMGRYFWDYMLGRNYNDRQLREMVERFGLRYAVTGRFAYRIIIPIWTPDGLMTWTGRSIRDDAEVRYLTLSPDHYPEGEAPPLANIKDLLLNEQDLADGGRTLITVEGPLDAIRIDYHMWEEGMRATCLFSKSLAGLQAEKLIEVGRHFDRRVLLLDKDARMDTFGVQNQLARGDWEFTHMPGAKDAAAMEERALLKFLSGLL